MTRIVSTALVGVACLAMASCASVDHLNPFKSKSSGIAAAKGERIPVLAVDEALRPSDALKGVAFDLPPAQPVAAWPLPGGSPDQDMVNVQAAPAFEVAWRHPIGVGSSRKAEVTAPPVAVDGKVFTMDGQAQVEATDAKSGRLIWRIDLRPKNKRDREAWAGGLAVADGKVLVTSGYRFVAALDSASGKVLWRKATTSPVHAAPTVAGGRVFAVDIDNQLLAFDAATGDEVWSYQALAEPARILKASSPAISGDEVVAPFSSGELVALSTPNGNAIWNQALSRTSRTNALSQIRDIPGRPVIYKGDVIAASQAGVVASLDVRTGSPHWQLPVASDNTPWAAGDVVFIVAEAGELIAANRENGQVYWIVDLNKGHERKEGGFLLVGKKLVKPIWSGPVLAGDRLIVVNNWGEALALNARTGATERRLKIGDSAYMAPIAYDGMLYVVTDKAHLIAIR